MRRTALFASSCRSEAALSVCSLGNALETLPISSGHTDASQRTNHSLNARPLYLGSRSRGQSSTAANASTRQPPTTMITRRFFIAKVCHKPPPLRTEENQEEIHTTK